MVGVEFFGNFDLASAAIWGFWLFFAGLIYYLQRENMREGYPLEVDDGSEAPNQGPFSVPEPKTFKLPHGRDAVTVPSAENEAAHRRTDLALARTGQAEGSPFAPTGNPMTDGVGPASWAPRRDEPELDAHGHAKIVPMSGVEGFDVSAGHDPRGLPVLAGDDKVVGEISDMWIDPGEAQVRYLEIALNSEAGGGKRLVPIQMARVTHRWVKVRSIMTGHFAGVPTTKSNSQITKLEEEKICAYYAGGTLYATPERMGGLN